MLLLAEYFSMSNGTSILQLTLNCIFHFIFFNTPGWLSARLYSLFIIFVNIAKTSTIKSDNLSK